jgi:hypothetical protein
MVHMVAVDNIKNNKYWGKNMPRIKLRALIYMGMLYIKREILRKVSGLLNTYLLLPPNFIEIRLTLRCNLRC